MRDLRTLDPIRPHASYVLTKTATTFSAKKSAYVWLSHLQHRHLHSSFKLGSINLVEVQSYKYLGVIFDARCSRKEQFDHVLQKPIAASYNVGRIISTTYAPSPVLIRHLVNVIIRTSMSFGLLFWRWIQAHLLKLNSLLLFCFRRFAGIARKVHSLSLSSEFNVPTIELIEDEEMMRFARPVSTLLAGHPSRTLFDASSLPGAGFNTGPRYPYLNSINAKYQSAKRKYQCISYRCQFDENSRIVRIATHLPLHAPVLPPFYYIPLRLFPSLQRIRHLHLLHNHHGQGLKTILNGANDLVNMHLPAYLKYDYERNLHIARFRCRLRLERGRTNQYLHHCDDSISPHCPSCGPLQRDTVQHILLECPQFRLERHACATVVFRSTGLFLSIPLVLDRSC